ncbi:H(+)/Cl(-) exchange transporter 5 [Zancudomyces culisetae]|uniref:H(+)/Cl(-) exchange transporter 5 n=1 Tax=Zancudomyces culisetae TaxID=1213189 RepID=A0A1R1PF97_ZANCU|nr:H(+)/Cl(-) exchange transporter 5 [Zancudomyces culisetae]|eukprot:OMH79637.1 H(+)/Cl(-) exchange transporter 5 [Zancudomyces culisetae]
MNRLKNTHFSSYGSLLPLNKNKKSNYSIEDTNSNTNDNQRARDRDRNSGVKYQRATSLSHSVGHSRGQKSAEAVPVSMHTRNTRDKQTGERIWYESYTTIDWLEDAKKEQDRLKALVINDSSYKKSWDKIEDWGLAAIVGVGCGIFAGVISQTTEYLSSLKVGYCSGDIFLGKEQCERKLIHKNAHSFFNTFFKNDYAKDNGNTRQVEWRSWESVLEPYGFGYYGGFLMFVVIGAVLGWIAAQIVLRNASERRKPSSPTTTANEDSEQRVGLRYSRDEQTERVYYGVGSGIPEVKSILSGFVIHEFLGLRVLLVKSTGLIFSVASGIMAGREGPMVHIASCIGNICTRLNRKKYDYNESGKRALGGGQLLFQSCNPAVKLLLCACGGTSAKILRSIPNREDCDVSGILQPQLLVGRTSVFCADWDIWGAVWCNIYICECQNQ